MPTRSHFPFRLGYWLSSKARAADEAADSKAANARAATGPESFMCILPCYAPEVLT